jgi:hypothetical protein
MNIKVLVLILISSSTSCVAGFDDSFIWHHSIYRPAADSGGFTGINSGFKIVYLHSNIYRVEALNWNFASIDYDKAIWGAGFDFSSTGYKQYYRRNRHRVYGKFNPAENIRLVSSLEVCTEKFLNSGYYTELTGGVYMAYMAKKFYLETGFAEIDLKKPYHDKARGEKLKPFVSGSWIFNDGLTLTIGIRRFENRRTRWVFDQYIAVNKNLALNFGYKNNPSDIYGGIDLTIKKISIIIGYCSIGGLSDSIIWGISFRK